MASKYISSPTVRTDCVERYSELNRGVSPLWRYVLYKLNEDETEIIVDHCCPMSSTEEEIVKLWKEKISGQHPCWIVMTISFLVSNGGKRDKTTLISWIPDTIHRETLKESAKVKMMSLGCSGALKKALKGVVCYVESNTPDELSFDYLLTKASKHEREPVDFKMIFS